MITPETFKNFERLQQKANEQNYQLLTNWAPACTH